LPLPYRLPIHHPKATKEQRRNVLTGTDARRIVEGDWLSLWREKRGLAEPVDLTHAWKPRLGLHTEPLHAWWHSHTEGVDLIVCPDRPCYFPDVDDIPAHYAATFDRWDAANDCPFEMKHSHARNCLTDAAAFYMPQIQWQLIVSGCERAKFSLICGNEEPDWAWVDADLGYQKRLRMQADTFWELVTTGIEPPEDVAPNGPLKALARTVPLDGLKPYDYSQHNEWCVKAARYVETKAIADECEQLKTELKELVPADAKEVTGAGVKISRNKKGALTLRVVETEDA
jgi:hypothetical protein